jgi:26S proteasome regulatory subunit N6
LCRLLDQGKLPLALSSITGLLREVKRLDDKALLVELHLIESRVLFELRNLPKSRASLTAGRTAAGSIYIGPEVQGEIDMQAGILHAEERDYRTAFSYFYEAFEGRNSVGGGGKVGAAVKAAAATAAAAAASKSATTPAAAPAPAAAAAAPHPAVAPLKYMLLCKILMGQPEDVPGLIAGKAGLKYAGKGLDALRAMAQAYADRSLTAFERVVEEFKGEVTGDGFITRHVAHLTDKLLEQNLLRLIEPFSCVELSHLAELIGLPALRVEAKLGQLILDKRVHATLDQGKGQLVVFDGEGPDKAYSAALKAIGNLGKVVDVLQKRAETDK